MTFREHPPIRIASGDGGCYIMHLRCMTFKASAGHDRNIFPQMPFFFQIYLLYVIKQFPFASK